MFMEKLSILLISIFLIAGIVNAEDIALELQMPSDMFSPGMTCGLNLKIQNTGEAYDNAQLFVALNIGTDDY